MERAVASPPLARSIEASTLASSSKHYMGGALLADCFYCIHATRWYDNNIQLVEPASFASVITTRRQERKSRQGGGWRWMAE